MRFHVCSLPHTQVTDAYSVCAYSMKVKKFCRMMKDLGHTVYLYAGEQNEAPCDELITCISEAERAACIPSGKHYVEAPFHGQHWDTFNHNAITGIAERAAKEDFICLIGGAAQKAIADALPHLMSVEFGIGYQGVFAKYRVFESYAWMHMIYGWQMTPDRADGQWYDAVIPNSFEPEAFPLQRQKGDYFLFIGRMVDRKGYRIACDVCKHLGVPLKLAGIAPDRPLFYGEYVGVVGPEKRAELMGRAKAVFVPTVYVEPFGGVAVEAMMCGTPVITTDWGAFTETVVHGKTGFRCRNFQGFVNAASWVELLDPASIRQHAKANYSLKVIGQQYQSYFERLSNLWRDGWYELEAS